MATAVVPCRWHRRTNSTHPMELSRRKTCVVAHCAVSKTLASGFGSDCESRRRWFEPTPGVEVGSEAAIFPAPLALCRYIESLLRLFRYTTSTVSHISSHSQHKRRFIILRISFDSMPDTHNRLAIGDERRARHAASDHNAFHRSDYPRELCGIRGH